jgi:hypothetical protein
LAKQEVSELDRELELLENELKRLEAEYNMFFAGRLPRPPWETRGRVTAMVRRLDNVHIPNTGGKFRFTTLQSRYQTFIDLWDRGLKAREEGRPGPFAHLKQPTTTEEKPTRPIDRILHVTTFSDPMKEMDKLQDLYESLAEARREVGEEAIPFHKFADLIKTQVGTFKKKGTPEVAFRVAVKHGKVAFTARAMKGSKAEEEEK